jgi:hypothetical protein
MVTPVVPMSISPPVDWNGTASFAAPPGTAGGNDTGQSIAQPAEADRQAFASLMQSPASSVARLEPGSKVAAPSMLEKFAATQNADMRELLQSTRDLVKAAPNLSMSEVMAFGNEMTMNIAVTTTQYNVAGNFAKSASKGVETLMRNQ